MIITVPSSVTQFGSLLCYATDHVYKSRQIPTLNWFPSSLHPLTHRGSHCSVFLFFSYFLFCFVLFFSFLRSCTICLFCFTCVALLYSFFFLLGFIYFSSYFVRFFSASMCCPVLSLFSLALSCSVVTFVLLFVSCLLSYYIVFCFILSKLSFSLIHFLFPFTSIHAATSPMQSTNSHNFYEHSRDQFVQQWVYLMYIITGDSGIVWGWQENKGPTVSQWYDKLARSQYTGGWVF